MATTQTRNTDRSTADEDSEFVPERFDVEGASYERNDGHVWEVDLPETAGENDEIEAAGVVVEKGGFGEWVVTLTALDAEKQPVHGGFLQPGSQVLSDFQTEHRAVTNATALVERLVNGEYGDVLESDD